MSPAAAIRSSSETSVPERCPQGKTWYSRKSPVGEQAVELLVGQEPVVDAVDLARAQRPRRRRDGEPELGNASQQRLNHRSLAGPEGPVSDEDRASSG